MSQRKIADVYKFTAIALLSVLLLFIAANAGVYLFETIREKFSPQADPVSEKYGKALELVYPEYTQGEIRELLRETWNLPLVYEPFTQFKEGPVKGKYVNVDPHGFRISKNQGPWPPNPTHLNVFLFGGSTTFGYSVADSDTVASYLQEALSQLNSQKKVSVYNFGRGFYYSTQERILFEQLLQTGIVPHVAIFIDGINENQIPKNGPAHTDELRRFMQRNPVWEIGLVVNRLPLVQIIRRQLIKLRDKQYLSQLKPPDDSAKNRLLKRVLLIVNGYLHNKRMIEAIAHEYGILATFVWQPAPTYRYDKSYHPFYQEGFDVRVLTNTAYDAIWQIEREGAMGNNFLNCSSMQENEKKPLYVDAVHYTAEMSRKFAEKIARMMLERNLLPEEFTGKTTITKDTALKS